jgi:hypothetical protein
MNSNQWVQILIVSLVVGLLYQYLKTSREGFQNQLLYLPERMTMMNIPTKYHPSVWNIGNQTR